jgi:hypothetical protein
LQIRNQGVERRNRVRQLWREHLQHPTEALLRKLNFARRFRRQEVVPESDTIYSTDRDLIEQRDYRLDEPAFRQLLESEAQQDRPETEQVRKPRPL